MAALRAAFTSCWHAMLTPILDPVACLPPQSTTDSEESATALLRRLEQQLQQRLKMFLPGEQRSLRRGDGLDFAELREYHPGDDLRKMDWSVFARTTIPHVREYHAETQAILWLAVDASASMRFGRLHSKAKLARELAGFLGILAQKNRFRVGGVLFGRDRSAFLFELFAPTSDASALQKLLTRLLALEVEGQIADINVSDSAQDPLPLACQRLEKLVQQGSSVFLLSDFLSWPVDTDNTLHSPTDNLSKDSSQLEAKWQQALGRLGQKAQLVSLAIHDPVELSGPREASHSLILRDSETGARFLWPGNDAQFLAQYRETMQARQLALFKWLERIGGSLSASTEQEALDILLSLLTRQNNWQQHSNTDRAH
jgi:hypothetical protein